MDSKKTKILLGQLNNAGDCLLATTIACQIKKDYPNSILTWAIGSSCRHILENNPHVDIIWEVPLSNSKPETILQAWEFFTKEVEIKRKSNEYDLIFLTQYSYGRLINFRGITRLSIFAGYPKKINVSVSPIINLTNSEIDKVKLFAEQNHLYNYQKVILFECSGYSKQTFIDDEFVIRFCTLIANHYPQVCVILSTNKHFEINGNNIINGNIISFRENAELTKYSDLFIGVSSGITWLSTSTGAKSIPKIILLSKDCPQASVLADHKYFGISHNNVLELNECSAEELVKLATENKFTKHQKKQTFFEKTCFYDPIAYHLSRKDYRQVMEMFLTTRKTVYKLTIIKYIIRYIFNKKNKAL